MKCAPNSEHLRTKIGERYGDLTSGMLMTVYSTRTSPGGRVTDFAPSSPSAPSSFSLRTLAHG